MRFYYGCMGFLIASTLAAQSQNSLTLEQAILLAYKNNPSLKAQVALVEHAKGQFIQSKLYPNPSLSIQAENIGTPSTLESGYTGPEETISIEQPIPLGNRIYYQSNAAKMEYFAACMKLEASRSNLYIDVGNAYVDAFYAQYWTQASKRLVKFNQLVVSSIKKRLEIGANSEVDLKLAEIGLDESILIFNKARRYELKSKRLLANLIAVSSLEKTKLNEKGFSHHLDTWPSIKNRLITSNLIKAQMALVKAMGARITATAKEIWPNLNVQLGFRHFKLYDQKALVISTASQIPVFDQNQGNLYSAHAKRNQAIQDLHQLKLNLETLLYESFLDASQSKEEAQIVTSRMLPSAKKAVRLARSGFEQGRYSYLVLNNAMLVLNREEQHYARAHANYHKALIKIQGLLMGGRDEK
ncbi:TolC family protein [Legionella jordanis]|uniref:TolC family protein n=1 Tax=Legionella jordanis TaxID=456 RepID=UPI000EFED6F9|nr:TolC family protein [Legionella jordanis]RMX15330.1 TolC family protein [Legionella jordanis]